MEHESIQDDLTQRELFEAAMKKQFGCTIDLDTKFESGNYCQVGPHWLWVGWSSAIEQLLDYFRARAELMEGHDPIYVKPESIYRGILKEIQKPVEET